MMMDLILDTPVVTIPTPTACWPTPRRYGQVVLPVVQASTGAVLLARRGRCRSSPRLRPPSAMVRWSSTPTSGAQRLSVEGFGGRHPQLALALLKRVDPRHPLAQGRRR